MKEASITIKVDQSFKDQCDELFAGLGMTTSDAIDAFLHQAVMEQAMPFRPREKRDALSKAMMDLPEAGYVNASGDYVLPKEWDYPEDDIYEKYL